MAGDEFLTDDEFVRAFHSGALPNERFHHRDHLRLAWFLSRKLGPEEASRAISSGIQRFAAHHGHAAKYHETMTVFWVRIVGHLVTSHPDIADFETFLATFPMLLDKDLPYRHWRRETMNAPAARAHWVEPDLLGLPA